MKNPLVSLVLSCYNRPAMFERAVQSAIAQTYTNLEILVQDDSTNSGCTRVAEEIHDGRIVYQRNAPSLGIASNLLAGYRKAKGKYFCTLNDDDFYAPQYVETMVAALENDSSCSVAFCDHFIVNAEGTVDLAETEENSRRFGRSGLTRGRILNPLRAGMARQCVPGMFALFRRCMMDLEDFPLEVSSGYDAWLVYLALRDGHNAFYFPERLTYYRVHLESQSARFAAPAERLRFLEGARFRLERFIADPRLESVHGSFRSRLAKNQAAFGFAFMRLGDASTARGQFWISLRLKPDVRSLVGLFVCCLPTSQRAAILRAVARWKTPDFSRVGRRSFIFFKGSQMLPGRY